MARLLVVEDDEIIGGTLEQSLRTHGHEVSWARSGRGQGELDLVFAVGLHVAPRSPC